MVMMNMEKLEGFPEAGTHRGSGGFRDMGM
jgi:hypothetical protein